MTPKKFTLMKCDNKENIKKRVTLFFLTYVF